MQLTLSLSAENHFDDVHGGDMYYRGDYINKVIENSDEIDIREDVSKWWDMERVYNELIKAKISIMILDRLIENGSIRCIQAGNGTRYRPTDFKNWLDELKSSS